MPEALRNYDYSHDCIATISPGIAILGGILSMMPGVIVAIQL